MNIVPYQRDRWLELSEYGQGLPYDCAYDILRFDEDVNAMVVVPSHRISERSVR